MDVNQVVVKGLWVCEACGFEVVWNDDDYEDRMRAARIVLGHVTPCALGRRPAKEASE